MISGCQKTMGTCASFCLSLLVFAVSTNDMMTENRETKKTTRNSFRGHVDFEEERNVPEKSLKILLRDLRVTDIRKLRHNLTHITRHLAALAMCYIERTGIRAVVLTDCLTIYPLTALVPIKFCAQSPQSRSLPD